LFRGQRAANIFAEICGKINAEIYGKINNEREVRSDQKSEALEVIIRIGRFGQNLLFFIAVGGYVRRVRFCSRKANAKGFLLCRKPPA
jgi:hypothetical protein